MRKYLVPAGIVVAAFMAVPAEARTCPAGQIFRVKLDICAPRAENIKWLHRGGPAKRLAHKPATKVMPEAAVPPETQASNLLKYAPVVAAPVVPDIPAEAPVEAASPSSVSPYGALKLEAF